MSIVGAGFEAEATERRHRMGHAMLVVLGLAAFGVALLLLPAHVQQAGGGSAGTVQFQPAAGSATGAHIDGFRSVHFGMDEAAVRAAIREDFGVTGDAVAIIDNPVEQTRMLVVQVPDFIEGVRPAELAYIFDEKGAGLVQVDLRWGTQQAPPVMQGESGPAVARLSAR
jgi:hypothetical protein